MLAVIKAPILSSRERIVPAELLGPLEAAHIADDREQGEALIMPMPSSFMQRSISGSAQTC